MDWQEVSALGVVAVTALLLIRHLFSRRNHSTVGCGTSCACPAAAERRAGGDTLNVDPQNNILHHRFTQDGVRTLPLQDGERERTTNSVN